MNYNFYKNDKWLISQKIVESRNKKIFIKERQIWWVNFGYNIGNEIFGKGDDFKRPFLVLKKAGNMYIGIPLTTSGLENSDFYYFLGDNYTDEKSFLALTQIKSLDKKRFIEKISTVSNDDFESIKKEFQKYLFGNS